MLTGSLTSTTGGITLAAAGGLDGSGATPTLTSGAGNVSFYSGVASGTAASPVPVIATTGGIAIRIDTTGSLSGLGARPRPTPTARPRDDQCRPGFPGRRRFARWLGQLDTLPTVTALREHGNDIVEQVLAENSGRWESASPRDLARIEAIARALMSRLLHEPTIRLRSLSEERGHASLELVRELFALREDAPSQEPAATELAEVHDLRRRRER